MNNDFSTVIAMSVEEKVALLTGGLWRYGIDAAAQYPRYRDDRWYLRRAL